MTTPTSRTRLQALRQRGAMRVQRLARRGQGETRRKRCERRALAYPPAETLTSARVGAGKAPMDLQLAQ